MSNLNFERRLDQSINEGIDRDITSITPGLHLQVFYKGRLHADLSYGKVYPYYDLASLTKVIFTVPALMKAVQDQGFDLHKEVRHYLSWWPHKGQTAYQFLTHTAGLPWWFPFYEKLNGPMNHLKRWQQLKSQLAVIPREKRNQAIYSDVDFLALGCLVEELYQKPLNEVWQAFQERWKVPTIDFHVNNRPIYARKLYAPTEKCRLRKKTLQGEVHDENTWFLGGVAPHAGLFGSMKDLSRWALLLRKGYVSDKGSLIARQAIVRKFTRRTVPTSQGDWGLGFMKPTKGKASCGSKFSLSSFGHTGFTGTSIWYDPPKDLLVCILSNRVHPSRENRRFVELRPQLHEWICESL